MTDTAAPDAAPDPAELRPFSEWITDHAQGTVDDEMTAALASLVEAVAHHGKKGTVTLKISVDTAGSGGRSVETSCVVESKEPTADPERSIFFVGHGGSMHRDDPFQKRLPLKRVTPQPQLPQE
jgi:hypothetical protein